MTSIMLSTKRALPCVFAMAVTMLVFGGCDEKSERELKERSNQAQDDMSRAVDKAAQAAKDVGAEAKQAWESFKTQSQPVIDDMHSKAEELKRDGSTYHDDKLDGLLAQLDAKMRDIGDKLRGAFSSENMESLKQSVNAMLDDAKQLFDKAKTRLNELRASHGGG